MFAGMSLRRRFLLSLAAGFAIAGLFVGACGDLSHAPEVEGPEEAAAAAAAAFGKAIAEDGRGGAVFGVFRDGEALVVEGFGFADAESSVPVRGDHVFRIGSITKPVTAMAMLRLVHEGKARLGDPVASFVPELGRVTNPFDHTPGPTLYQLGTMTGGLAREPESLPVYLIGAPEIWKEVAFRALSETSFEYEPGTRYQYSNIGYAVLGAAVESAAGEPFIGHVARELLDPLGMDSTAFWPSPAIEGRIAAGAAVQDDGSLDFSQPAAEHAGRGYKVPNGAVYSTASDLDRFLRFLTGAGGAPFDEVLPAGVRHENLTRAFAAGDLSSGYGFGFQTRRLDDAAGEPFTAYGHGGSVAGYRAAAWIEPGTGVSAVVLRNVGGDGMSLSDFAFEALARVVAAVRDGGS